LGKALLVESFFFAEGFEEVAFFLSAFFQGGGLLGIEGEEASILLSALAKGGAASLEVSLSSADEAQLLLPKAQYGSQIQEPMISLLKALRRKDPYPGAKLVLHFVY
jgi:hypothetical protein